MCPFDHIACLSASSLGSLSSIMSNIRSLPAPLAWLGLLPSHPSVGLEAALVPARPPCHGQLMLLHTRATAALSFQNL